MSLSAVIVDDEQLARDELAYLLKNAGDVDVVAQGKNGLEAVHLIKEHHPDLVFLDVQMPGMDGFEVLRALPKEKLPRVIFLTAYEKHALRAFEVHALDYLLKPVDDQRFALAIHRARNILDSASKTVMVERLVHMLNETSEKYISRFTVKAGSRIQIVLAEDVEWIGAAGDYAELHAYGRAYLLREPMSSLEQKLNPKRFLRIHRSRIVRAAGIQELRAIDNREFIVKLSDGSEHRSSRTYAERLESWLSSGRS